MSSGTLAKISPVTPPVLNIKIKPKTQWRMDFRPIFFFPEKEAFFLPSDAHQVILIYNNQTFFLLLPSLFKTFFILVKRQRNFFTNKGVL
jgi:hypothetical protein